jgi:hypothetical protein
MRFTIGSIMIAIVVVAIALALPDGLRAIAAALAVPCLSAIAAHWLIKTGRRRLAAITFWTLAVWSNALCAACCIVANYSSVLLMVLAWMFVIFPTLASLGTAWAILGARDDGAPRRAVEASGLLVFAMGLILPLAMFWTYWPLHVAFLAARPTLDHLADQVAAGMTVSFPQRAGPFTLQKTAVDRVSGNVALMTDSNPRHPKGFVRLRTADPPNPFGPFVGSNLQIALDGEWSFRDDD